jgi:hypothetical protein
LRLLFFLARRFAGRFALRFDFLRDAFFLEAMGSLLSGIDGLEYIQIETHYQRVMGFKYVRIARERAANVIGCTLS